MSGSRRPLVIAALVCLAVGGPAAPARAQAVRALTAIRAVPPPVVDGRLDDPVWAAAVPAGGFLQRDPDEGKPATEETFVRVAFDDHALYVAAEMRDRHPSGIVRQLSRRDAAVEADALVVYLDPHDDRLTGAQFGVSAAGVQRDALIYNDNFLDATWDAVWASAVEISPDGWTAEMRIPLAQLRFPKAERYTWGINVQRIIQRRNEADWLRLVPKNESGLASKMARLEGIAGIDPPTALEFMPYVTAREEFVAPVTPGSPFNDGSRFFAGAGLDLKYGLSSSLTLDATFNPDFGQVEVDPAVVNLTQFETFFEERRPFFTEGAKVFGDFGRSGASQYWGFFRPEPTLYYSRRIGRYPQVKVNDRYVDIPAWTTILGAAKVVGRTRNGWTLGVLEAITGREYAQLSDGARTVTAEVEPLSSYTVFRAQRGLGRRGAIGVLGTSVFRDLNEPALRSYLTDRAAMLGVDGHVFLDGARTWVFHGGLAGSSVHGSTDAITRLQKAEQRYLQRPDVDFVKLDPTATSMSGWNGQANVNRNSGNITVNLGIWGMSPGLEVNDAGYSTQTDRAGAHAMLQYRKLTPDRWSSERTFWVSKWWTWNWGWQSQGDGWQASATFRLKNMWRTSALFTYAKRVWDDKLTRGGPTVIRPGNRGIQLAVATDSRKTAVLSLGGSYTDREYGASALALDAQLAWRPFPALTLAAGPTFRKNLVSAQYLSTVADPYATRTYSNRYVFGDLGQTEVSATTRVSLATSPRTSLQLYFQPLISAADYGAIKEVYAPRTYDFLRYGIDAGTITPSGSRYVIDPDAEGPAAAFSIAQPDFNLTSLRVNAVFRWEFRPGSSFYAVWTQQRLSRLPSGDFDLSSGISRLYTSPADDVFLVKVSYWFGARR
jgi:hypothetical protein